MPSKFDDAFNNSGIQDKSLMPAWILNATFRIKYSPESDDAQALLVQFEFLKSFTDKIENQNKVK